MPEQLPTYAMDSADAAISFAKSVRGRHARKTPRSSHQRRADIGVALDRLHDAMAPLRSAIASFPYGPQTTTAEANREKIREKSRELQRERRKLWKMNPRKRRRRVIPSESL